MPPRLFTLDEANRLMPTLEPLLRRLVEKRQALREHAQVIEEFRAEAYARAEQDRELLRLLARGEKEIAAGKGHSLAAVLAEADALLAERDN